MLRLGAEGKPSFLPGLAWCSSRDWGTLFVLSCNGCDAQKFPVASVFFLFNFLSAVLTLVVSFVWQEGAILVFLPGWDNISTLNDLLMAQQMFRSGAASHVLDV